MPPPPPEPAVLLTTALLIIDKSPWSTSMPPPDVIEERDTSLLATTESINANPVFNLTRTAPPPPDVSVLDGAPSLRVKPATVTPVGVSPFCEGKIVKILDLWLPLIAKTFAPGPWIMRFFVITISPLVNAIIPVTLGAKVTVLLLQAFCTASRNDPGPLSELLVTIGEQLFVR